MKEREKVKGRRRKAKVFDAASEIFELLKTSPREERYSLTDTIRKKNRQFLPIMSRGSSISRLPASVYVHLLSAVRRRTARGDRVRD